MAFISYLEEGGDRKGKVEGRKREREGEGR